VVNFKAVLEYNGTRYSGWQDQKNARTITGELRKAAIEAFGCAVEIQGAGRTDAGVHALGQVASLRVATDPRKPADTLKRRLNELLPSDIVVLDLEIAARTFHPRHDAVSRVYLYQIARRKQAFIKKYVWWVKDPLDIAAMSRAAGMLAGRHDFVCFRAADSSKFDESTIVVVEKAQIEVDDDIIQFRIEASHFLWRMVRRIVGVLVKIGTGEVSEKDFSRLLEGKCDSRLDIAAWTAPASGLFLEEVRYK
jgi:tRNA pseudouridine38-40 synthase